MSNPSIKHAFVNIRNSQLHIVELCWLLTTFEALAGPEQNWLFGKSIGDKACFKQRNIGTQAMFCSAWNVH